MFVESLRVVCLCLSDVNDLTAASNGPLQMRTRKPFEISGKKIIFLDGQIY
jgi:hypothetical protein